MSDQPKSDEAKAGANDGQTTFSRRAFLGVGGIGLASATGLAFAQQNGANTTTGTGNGGSGQQSGSQSTSDNGSENENEDEKGDSREVGDKSDANENEGSESEDNNASDGNNHAEKNEGADNGNVGNVKLSKPEAQQIATKKVGGGTIQRVEREVEDAPKYSGTSVYNVIVKTSGGAIKEVTINADTGDVLKVDNGA